MKPALADRNCQEAQWPRSQMKPALTLMTISTLTLLLGCSLVLALDPSLEASPYARTAWKVRDGFSLGDMYATAQTPAGQDLRDRNIHGLTNQASFRADRKTRAASSLRDSPDLHALAGHPGVR